MIITPPLSEIKVQQNIYFIC